MRIETAGDWGDRDVFQLRSRDFYIDNGLVGATMLAANALSETSSAYLAPVHVLEMHADGYPLCEGRTVDSQNPPPVLLPDRAALKEWCIYAARYRSEVYERAWVKNGGSNQQRGAAASFLLGNKRRLLHCDYFCTYLDEIGIGVAFEPCAYDGKRFYTGYYTYGLATVLQQWKHEDGKTHIIVSRSDCNAIDNVVDKVYGWYDGGEASRMSESLWHEGHEES